MSVVLCFPKKFHRHGRTSSSWRGAARAARSAIKAASIPAALATSVAMIDAHHSEGMRSRCDHFGMAVTGAPVSRAIAACEGQSAMIERKQVGAVIESLLGQIVLNDKANVSYDCGDVPGQHCPMVKGDTKTGFKQQFLERVTAARLARDLTQEDLAALLDIPQDRYKHFEKRSFLPHDMIPRFLLATGVDYAWLFTGKGKGPNAADVLEKARRQARPKARRKAA